MIKSIKRQKWIWLDRIQLREKIQNKSLALKIIIGAGNTNYDGWISTDYPVFNVLQKWQWKFFLGHKKAKNILTEHVLEHFKEEEVTRFLQFSFMYLLDGGVLRVAVPDEFHKNPKYIEYVRPNGTGPGADDHKSFWNYNSLSQLGGTIGYNIELVEYWDENGNFYSMDEVKDRGHIIRSKGNGFKSNIEDYSSLIIDFIK